jgi:hypothetical protein
LIVGNIVPRNICVIDNRFKINTLDVLAAKSTDQLVLPVIE